MCFLLVACDARRPRWTSFVYSRRHDPSCKSTLTSFVWDNLSLVCGLKFGTSYSLRNFFLFGHPKRVNQNRSWCEVGSDTKSFSSTDVSATGIFAGRLWEESWSSNVISPLVIEQEQSQNLILSLNLLDEFMVKCHEWFNTEMIFTYIYCINWLGFWIDNYQKNQSPRLDMLAMTVLLFVDEHQLGVWHTSLW